MTGKAEIRKNIASKNNKISRNLNINFNMTRGAPTSRISNVVNKSGWIGSANTDLNMNTFDILSVDRLKFSTTTGSGDSLVSTDTGIEALYLNGTASGMKVQIPSTNFAVYTINRGSSNILNISSLGTQISGDVYLGTVGGDSIGINGSSTFNSNVFLYGTTGSYFYMGGYGTASQTNFLDASITNIRSPTTTIGLTNADSLKINSKIGFFGTTPVVKSSLSNITNSITATGTTNTLANFTDLTTFSNSSTAIRGDLYQLGLKVNAILNTLQGYGLI